MRTSPFTLVAFLLAAIGIGTLVYVIVSAPTVLRIAVGPVSSDNMRIVVAALQVLQREREPFRLRLIPTEGSAQSARLLDEGEADLAVVRTDIAYPQQGATVAVLRTDHAVLIAPGGQGIASIADLRGKAIGVVRDSPGNQGLLTTIMAQANLMAGDYTLVRLRPAEIKGALDAGRVQALLAVGPNFGRFLLDVVQAVADVSTQGPVKFIPVPDAAAIEQRSALIESETLVRGLFGGAPPRPERDIPTVMVSNELLAAKSLSEPLISDFTRVLINAKAMIAAETPLAARLDPPDQERTSPIPIHPGTITYLDGQTTTFFERYGDWFYIAIMFMGLAGSGVAAFVGARAQSRRKRTMAMLIDLQSVVTIARKSNCHEELSELDDRADNLMARTMAEATDNNLDSGALLAFSMAFEHARRAIIERRKHLDEQETPERAAARWEAAADAGTAAPLNRAGETVPD